MCVRDKVAMRRRAFLKGAGVAGGAAVGSMVLGLGARPLRAGVRTASLERLARAGITLGARLQRHEGSRLLAAVEVPLQPHATARREIGGAAWACSLRGASPVKGQPDAVEL